MFQENVIWYVLEDVAILYDNNEGWEWNVLSAIE